MKTVSQANISHEMEPRHALRAKLGSTRDTWGGHVALNVLPVNMLQSKRRKHGVLNASKGNTRALLGSLLAWNVIPVSMHLYQAWLHAPCVHQDGTEPIRRLRSVWLAGLENTNQIMAQPPALIAQHFRRHAALAPLTNKSTVFVRKIILSVHSSAMRLKISLCWTRKPTIS